MSEEIQSKPRPGRPRKAESRPQRAGAGSLLSAQISVELRERLEAEARRTGLSLSKIAERWLEIGEKGDMIERAGGLGPAVALDRLASMGARVRRDLGKDPSDDEYARRVLLAAWRYMLTASFPPATNDPLWSTLIAIGPEVVERCRQLLGAVATLSDDDPVKRAMVAKTLREPASAGSDASINAFASFLGGDFVPLFTPLAKVVSAPQGDLPLTPMVSFVLDRLDEAGSEGASAERAALRAAITKFDDAFDKWKATDERARAEGTRYGSEFVASLRRNIEQAGE